MASNTGFGTENWSPYTQHVQGGLRDSNYLTGKNTVICAGPPFLSALSSTGSQPCQ